jgi:CrcB protein
VTTWIVIGVGGALGAMARHAVNHVVHQRMLSTQFPVGIVLVNVFGSFAIGLLAGAIAAGRVQLSDQARTFAIVGLLGGFTTFSSFSFDTYALVRAGHHAQAFWNVTGQVALSLLGVWAGFRLAH